MTQTTLRSVLSLGIGLALLLANGRLTRSMLASWSDNRRDNDVSRAVVEYSQRTRVGRFLTTDRFQRWFVRGWWLIVAGVFLSLGVRGLT